MPMVLPRTSLLLRQDGDTHVVTELGGRREGAPRRSQDLPDVNGSPT